MIAGGVAILVFSACLLLTYRALEWGAYFLSFDRTDRKGRLLLPFLPPGSHRANASELGMTSESVEFRVFARRATPVTLGVRTSPDPDGRRIPQRPDLESDGVRAAVR